MAHAAESCVADLRVQQAIASVSGRYEDSPQINVHFQLIKPATVVVEIARHAPSGTGIDNTDSPLLAEPVVVRRLELGRLPAGQQTTTWDGLDSQGKPITLTLADYAATGTGAEIGRAHV